MTLPPPLPPPPPAHVTRHDLSGVVVGVMVYLAGGTRRVAFLLESGATLDLAPDAVVHVNGSRVATPHELVAWYASRCGSSGVVVVAFGELDAVSRRDVFRLWLEECPALSAPARTLRRRPRRPDDDLPSPAPPPYPLP